MTTNTAARPDVMPSATPTDVELEAWASMSRESQLGCYRNALTHPDCNAVTDDDMSDILEAARARVAPRIHG